MDEATRDGLEPRSGLAGEEDLCWVRRGQARGVSGSGCQLEVGRVGVKPTRGNGLGAAGPSP
jgi:hypothetical protein